MMVKRSEELANIRLIRSDIINFGGMGVTKRVTDKQIMSIPIIDNADIILPIRTLEDALRFLKEFE